VFRSVARDAWRQYRRRPAAAVLAVAVEGLPVFLPTSGSALVAAPVAVALLALGLLLELFLIAWLAGALHPRPVAAVDAVAAMRRAIWPGVRAGLLRGVYLLAALVVGLLLFGAPQNETLSSAQQAKLSIGLWPLLGFALAFLAVIEQRIVLDGERVARRAAAMSHRVAAANFPLCLLIGLGQAAGLVLAGLPVPFAAIAALAMLLAVVDPFLIGMANALYLRSKSLQALRPGEPA
jgi:uncharacterized membrane protein